MESQYSHSHVYVIVFVGSKSQPIWNMLNWSRIVVVVEHVQPQHIQHQSTPSKEHKSQKSRTGNWFSIKRLIGVYWQSGDKKRALHGLYVVVGDMSLTLSQPPRPSSSHPIPSIVHRITFWQWSELRLMRHPFSQQQQRMPFNGLCASAASESSFGHRVIDFSCSLVQPVGFHFFWPPPKHGL